MVGLVGKCLKMASSKELRENGSSPLRLPGLDDVDNELTFL